MPTFTHGKDAVVILDNTNLSTTLTDVAVSLTADVNETSTFSSTSKTFVKHFETAAEKYIKEFCLFLPRTS